MTKRSITVIDTHVHFYEQFQLDRLFDAAWQNAEQIARHQFADVFFVGLCIANMKTQNWLPRFKSESAFNGHLKRWSIDVAAGGDDCAVAIGPAGEKIFLLFGQQIVTAEGLEVLLYHHHERISDGEPVRAIITAASPDSLCILPWGVGKWLGKRGQFVSQLLEEFEPGAFLLGDNSGRPAVWRSVRLFDKADARGFRVIPGSDPLGISDEEDRVGGYAEFYYDQIDAHDPAASMVRIIKNTAGQAYGNLEGFNKFVTNQIKIRL